MRTVSSTGAGGGIGRHPRTAGPIIAAAAAALAAIGCKDSVVPFFTAPTSVPANASGVQNAVTGLFGAMRTDQQYFLIYMNAFARDALVFLSFDAQYVTELAGLQPGSAADFTGTGVWNNQFTNAKQANTIIATLPSVPDFDSHQAAAITGVLQTMKALDFMYLAETRDTLGVPIYSIVNGVSSPPYCAADVWRYIVALLDSGNASLNAAGPIPLPVVLPPGFGAVGQTAGPSSTPGAFAAFNRALAGKAGLELAYAIARSTPGTRPTPASAGVPDASALGRADSALTASALYNTGAIAPPLAGPFALDPFGVYHTYSAQSGDAPNPLNRYYLQLAPLSDLALDVDTANDLRWRRKFVPNPHPLQLPQYSAAAVPASYLPYSSTNSPEPIVRAEELALVRAEIQLGLGNYGAAITLINIVHQQAGGFATPLSIAPTYTAVRDSLMKELRISTVLEGSADHVLAIRMWGMEAVSDTTWSSTAGPDAAAVAAITSQGTPPVDLHTTISPIPSSEVQGRGGSYALTCSAP